VVFITHAPVSGGYMKGAAYSASVVHSQCQPSPDRRTREAKAAFRMDLQVPADGMFFGVM